MIRLHAIHRRHQTKSHRAVLILALLFGFATSAVAKGWEPVDQELLSNIVPVVEKDDDVEAVFWEIWVIHSKGIVARSATSCDEVEHYVRLKIFNQRGVEYAQKVEIPHDADTKIKDIKGRTIKPDGSIAELEKKDIYDRELLSTGKHGLKATSFAMPSVEPGAIVEYQWREVHPFNYFLYKRSNYFLQYDIPIQRVIFHFRPDLGTGLTSNAKFFNIIGGALTKEGNGFSGITLENVPAYKKEPRMPPESSVRYFIQIEYGTPGIRYVTSIAEAPVVNPSGYWAAYGLERYEADQKLIEPDRAVRGRTAEIIKNRSNPEEIIESLYNYVKNSIKNVDEDAVDTVPENKEDFKENKDPSDTLKRGIGTSSDILLLFASMATAAGLDARIGRTEDRSTFLFSLEYSDYRFLPGWNIAVKINNGWKFYDPSSAYLPLGMLPWGEEESYILIPDPKAPMFLKTPLSPAEKSLMKRKATFRLSQDGTLEGDVVLEFTGHTGAVIKELNDDVLSVERIENFERQFKELFPAAEITGIQIENVADSDKPFTCRFHIRIPDYGQRTGNRLLFQPVFFQKGKAPEFTDEDRTHDIDFHYPWSETDEVEIKLPEGYEIESKIGLQPINAGTVSKYSLQLSQSQDKQSLLCKRNFFFGSPGNILFKKDKYPPIKKLFDSIHEVDNYTVSLIKAADR
jgi:hypothetical protein